MTEKMNSLSDSSEGNGAMVFSKMPALISIGEEDQIFPQLPAAEQQELLCCKLYPDEKNGELSMQELSEVRYLCKEAAVTVFIVNGNKHKDLLCMQKLANHYSENEADFIIVVCQLEDNLKNDKIIQCLCEKANGLYYIKSNYVYWNLVVYLCWGIRAFRLHTKAPEAVLEDFDTIRKVFPRQSNSILEIIETYSSEKDVSTIMDIFLSCEDKIRKLKYACSGYFYITTLDGSNRKINKLKELHQQLCNITKDDQFFLTVFELESTFKRNTMLTVLRYSQDTC